MAPIAPSSATPAASPVAAEAPAGRRDPASFAELVDLLDEGKFMALAARLRHSARVVRFVPGHLVLSGSRPLSADMLAELIGALRTVTGQGWKVEFEDQDGTPSLREQDDAAEEARRLAAWNSDMVKAAREHFPETEMEDWPGKRSSI